MEGEHHRQHSLSFSSSTVENMSGHFKNQGHECKKFRVHVSILDALKIHKSLDCQPMPPNIEANIVQDLRPLPPILIVNIYNQY